jgi:hypothetical protein
MDNLCDTCRYDFVNCVSGKIVFGIDRDPSMSIRRESDVLVDRDADAVIECESYRHWHLEKDMNDEDRKLLTKFLSECWHGPYVTNYGHDCVNKICEKCWKSPEELDHPNNRTFTTAQDMMDLKDKLVEKHRWYGFIVFAKTRFSFKDYDPCYDNIETGFYDWLINPPRFCQLVADFLKKEE